MPELAFASDLGLILPPGVGPKLFRTCGVLVTWPGRPGFLLCS